MKTQVEFRSAKFPPYEGEQEEINPGLWGKRLAEYLIQQLAARSFEHHRRVRIRLRQWQRERRGVEHEAAAWRIERYGTLERRRVKVLMGRSRITEIDLDRCNPFPNEQFEEQGERSEQILRHESQQCAIEIEYVVGADHEADLVELE